MDDFGHVLHMALEWQISVHVSHYFYPFSVSICLTASCSLILTFAPLKFSSFPSPNSSIMCPSTSLFLHKFLLHIKNSTPTPLFFCALTLSLFLFLPCQSVPRSFMYMHTSPQASAAALSGFGGETGGEENQRWRDRQRERNGERERGQRGRESVTESERERWREGVKYF